MRMTQAKLAELAGVSRGTVDRVINHRGKVKPEIEQQILRLAEEYGYHRNAAASRLVRSQQQLTLGVVIQSVDTPFMALLKREMEETVSLLSKEINLRILLRSGIGIDAGRQLAELKDLETLGVDGIALTPVEDARIRDQINHLADAGVPVVTFNTDIPESRRLAYVGQDSMLSGRACASLMNLLLPSGGDVLLISGKYENFSQRRRIEGFQSEARSLFPSLHILPIINGDDDYQTSYQAAKHALLTDPSVRGIYIAANGQAGVCDAIRELKCREHVRYICHDLIDETRAGLREGLIDFVIDQDAKRQAAEPLQILTDYLLDGTRPKDSSVITKIDIRTAYNI